MSTKTRGQKIDEFLTNAKRITIITLLILWACVTLALGVSVGLEKSKVQKLEKQIEAIDKEHKELMDHLEAYYVYHN